MYCQKTTDEDCQKLLSYSYEIEVDTFLVVEKKDNAFIISDDVYHLPQPEKWSSEWYRDDIRYVQDSISSTYRIAYTVYEENVPMGLIWWHTVSKEWKLRMGIDGILVAQQFRGRGAWVCLLQTMIDHAKSMECVGVMMELDTHKYESCRLCQKMWFTLAGILIFSRDHAEPYPGSKDVLRWRYDITVA